MAIRSNFRALLVILIIAGASACRQEAAAPPDMQRSVVRLEVIAQRWDLRAPWNPGSLEGVEPKLLEEIFSEVPSASFARQALAAA